MSSPWDQCLEEANEAPARRVVIRNSYPSYIEQASLSVSSPAVLCVLSIADVHRVAATGGAPLQRRSRDTKLVHAFRDVMETDTRNKVESSGKDT